MTTVLMPLTVHRDHRRTFAENRYVYAVVSRRSKGVSIGLNLNPDKVCNFDCVYCQVDRTTPGFGRDVDVSRLLAELEAMLDLVASGDLFTIDRFAQTPAALRRLNDLAFSGDGEPTTCPEFPQLVDAVADIKRRRGLDAKIILITNATMFHRPAVRDALAVLAANGGEIWAKLDAGTETYYQCVERTTISLARVLENITTVARTQPLVIQSLFMKLDGEGPTAAEQEAFCQRLNDLTRAGGRISLVQVYTVARRPAEAFVAPLTNDEVDALAERVRRGTGLTVETFYGAG